MDVEQIETFFFEGMREGWAVSASKTAIPELPGSKCITYRRGKFSLKDYYFVSPDSDNSYGTTLIWVAEKPVWIMHYGGFYVKRAIPIMKAALISAYNQNLFIGGRGPKKFRILGNPMRYNNHTPNHSKKFEAFSGYEEVYEVLESKNEKLLGEHHFFGGLF